MKNIFAVSGVVIKEMYRRKDFYVLLIITVLITGLMASVTLFHDDQIVRYLKEICLLLIWISSLIIAITTVLYVGKPFFLPSAARRRPHQLPITSTTTVCASPRSARRGRWRGASTRCCGRSA